MKISELKSRYRELAELRREQQNPGSEVDDLSDAFLWYKTPENEGWWVAVLEGDYLEIPAESLADLDQLAKTGKQPNAEKIEALSGWVARIESTLSDADWYANLEEHKKVWDKTTTEHMFRAMIRELYQLIRSELI